MLHVVAVTIGVRLKANFRRNVQDVARAELMLIAARLEMDDGIAFVHGIRVVVRRLMIDRVFHQIAAAAIAMRGKYASSMAYDNASKSLTKDLANGRTPSARISSIGV